MLTPPIEPMLARPLDALPPARATADVLYQAKADGFRALAFVRDGAVFLQSRRGGDLTPAFPDIAAGGSQLMGEDVVLDGELVVLGTDGRLDFDTLQQRARYRGPRAAAAATTAPAHLVVFDALEHRGRSLLGEPLRERWDLLVDVFEWRSLHAPWTLVPCTRDRTVALGWFDPAWGEAGIEGVVVKRAAVACCLRGLSPREVCAGKVQAGGMAGAPIVVHRLSEMGGRRVVVRGEIVGLAHSDHDVDVFLERVGLPDADMTGLLDDPRWVEWRGDPPHEWDSDNPAGS